MWGVVVAGLAMAVALASAGCDDDDTNGTGGTGATPTATGGTGGNTGGTGGSTGGTGGSGGQASARGGLIFGSSGTYFVNAGGTGGGFEVGLSILVARFDDNWSADFSTDCAQTSAGSCTRAVCPPPSSAATPFPTAGTINITGGVQDPVTLTPDAAGLYSSDLTNTEALFTAGQTLSFTAAGDEVPSFSSSVTGPGSLTLTSPVFSVGQVTIDTTADLGVAWTGGASGEVVTTLGGTLPGSEDQISVYCYFDAAGGTGTVPAALMSDLTSVEATSAFASVGALARSTTDADGWDVTVMLQMVAQTEIGGPTAGRATFE